MRLKEGGAWGGGGGGAQDGQESDLHSLMVLSFSSAPEAIMFSVG